MNVLIRLFLILLLMPAAYSFNVCNVDFQEPWFKVNDSSGIDVLIVDNEGDIYLEGQDHALNNRDSEESFIVNDMYFNSITSKFNSFEEGLSVLPNIESLIIKSSSGEEVAKFGNDNKIYTKGKAAYEGSQAGCLDDGNYCSGDIVEDRNYYCDLSGSKSGACIYSVLNSEDCSTKPSTDSDGGINYMTKGTVTDYVTCSGGSCTSNIYTDYCSSDTLREYYPDGSSYSYNDKNCNDYNTAYCIGDDEVWTTNYNCGSGECYQTADLFVQYCPVSSTEYSSWSCHDSDTKVRSVTEYSPTCSSGTCDETSTTTKEYKDCSSELVCKDGECVDPVIQIIISSNTVNYNLFNALGSPTNPVNVEVIINSGIYVWSDNTAIPAFDTGSLPVGSQVKLINNGYIMGKGGAGAGYNRQSGGEDGGNAISIFTNINIDNNNGYIAGGGGGGGAGYHDSSKTNWIGGGGGAGGGAGGSSSCQSTQGLGGIGGTIGSIGNDGKKVSSCNRFGGGGGGRILPGSATSNPGKSVGGTAGGGGGVDYVTIFDFSGGFGGGPEQDGGSRNGGGGGGGWGSSGGSGGGLSGSVPPGAAGKAIQLNGYTVTWLSDISNVYGPIS